MAVQQAPKFQEEYSAKLPALTLLTSLGWSFLSPAEALAKRGGKYDQVVLRDVLRPNSKSAPSPLLGRHIRCRQKPLIT